MGSREKKHPRVEGEAQHLQQHNLGYGSTPAIIRGLSLIMFGQLPERILEQWIRTSYGIPDIIGTAQRPRVGVPPSSPRGWKSGFLRICPHVLSGL